MDGKLERFLDELWAAGRRHDAELPDRTQRSEHERELLRERGREALDRVEARLTESR